MDIGGPMTTTSGHERGGCPSYQPRVEGNQKAEIRQAAKRGGAQRR